MNSLVSFTFYDDLEWHIFNHTPGLSIWKDKVLADYYVLDFAWRGELQWGMEQGPLQWLKGPVAFWTFPGPRFCFGRKDGGSWDHYFVAFRGPRAKRYAESGLFPIKQRPAWKPVNRPDRFRTQFEALLQRLDARERNSQTVPLLESLLRGLHEPIPDSNSENTPDSRLSDVPGKIDRDPLRDWDFHVEASRCGLSYPHFRRLFQAATGHPPHRYLLNQRFESAARRLRTSDASVKSVALASGFDDIYHFSKLFKERFRLPPGQYRLLAQAG